MESHTPSAISFLINILKARFIRSLILAVVMIFLLNEVLFLGFKQTFPSAKVSYYIKQQIEPHSDLSVQMAPIELKSWRQMILPQFLLVDPSNDTNFFELSQTSIKWNIGLFKQSIALSSLLYGGRLSGLVQVFPLGSGYLSLSNVAIQQLRTLHHLPYVKLSGLLKTLHVNVDEFGQLPQTVPIGFINVTLQNLKLQFTKEDIPLPIQIPEIHLADVQLVATYGEEIELEEASLSGDLEGTASGSILLDRENFLNSTAMLTVKFKLSSELKERLAQDPMLYSILAVAKCGDLIHARLSGTLQLWNPPEKLCS